MKLLRFSFPAPASRSSRPGGGQSRLAFSLIEIMVVVALFSLIILALLSVFNTTQGAFRTSVTQTDVQEGGRAAMDLITADLRAMTASDEYSNAAVNFYANPSVYYIPAFNEPLLMTLSPGSVVRTNVLEEIFILSRANQTWTGVGYVVDFLSPNYVNPLYRYSKSMNVRAGDPLVLYTNFIDTIAGNYAFEAASPGTPNTNWLGMSRLLQGVVHFTVRAYGTNGQWLASSCTNGPKQVAYPNISLGTAGFYMFSNALPASVELQVGVLEDRALRHAEGLSDFNARSNYLSSQAGRVHLFRQQVSVPNFDPAAYQ